MLTIIEITEKITEYKDKLDSLIKINSDNDYFENEKQECEYQLNKYVRMMQRLMKKIHEKYNL